MEERAAAKILLVEDDGGFRSLVRDALNKEGLRVLEAESAAMGLELFRAQSPDLVVLDLHLPDGSGLEVCSAIRQHRSRFATPVIMLTAASKLKEKAEGFGAGADQYLIKPVVVAELMLWVQALLRRLELEKGPQKILEAGDLCIEWDNHIVRYQDISISILTRKEFELLYFLVRNRPKVLSRKFILAKLWHTIAVDNVVDVHVGNLRRKLPPGIADRVQSVTGKGFRYMG